MSLLLFNMMLALSIIDHDVYDPYDLDDYLNRRPKPKEKTTMKLNPCGECGGTAVPMTSTSSGRPLFWWQCNNKKCSAASEAVTRKKKSDRKWNQLSILLAELKKRKWTA